MAGGEFRVRGHDAAALLFGERPLAQGVPAVVELPAVRVSPLQRHVVRGVGSAGREVHEERAIRGQGRLLAHPGDRAVGHVLGEVVLLVGIAVRFDRGRPVVQRGRELVGLTTEEPEEVLEPATTGGPRIERSHRAGLPHRHLVALAELGGRIPVEPQHLGQGCCRLGSHRGVARDRRGDLGDRAHPDRVMVAAGQQRLAGRRAQRRRVEPGVGQTIAGQPLGRGCPAGPSEHTRRTEADIVEQDHQDVGGTLWCLNRPDRLVHRPRVLRVLVHRTRVRRVRDGQDGAVHGVDLLQPRGACAASPSSEARGVTSIAPHATPLAGRAAHSTTRASVRPPEQGGGFRSPNQASGGDLASVRRFHAIAAC